MPCSWIKLSNGTVAIVKHAAPRRTRCQCGSGLFAELLCDWKVGPGKTCDAKICRACSTAPASGKDLCRVHTRAWHSHPSNPFRRDYPVDGDDVDDLTRCGKD